MDKVFTFLSDLCFSDFFAEKKPFKNSDFLYTFEKKKINWFSVQKNEKTAL